ncbi:sulfite exporter TauE/SafE family protein [Roseibium sp.]|uniref:sulfite exporter TauE/SafE family protein n=1 Tax=Roseibium sp. TaxID=1936156 RepID=UPI003D142C59
MDLSLSFYVVSIIAILITGISKSGFGGGLGVMAVPIMSLFVAPQFAAAVLMPVLLAMDVLIAWRYRHQWNRPIVFALLPGALVGLGIGGVTFQYMHADAIRFVVGLLALFFVLQFLAQRRQLRVARQTPEIVISFLGGISGFASFVAHAGGPPVKGYLLRQKLEKATFVGTNTMYFFTLNALKTIAYGSAGTLAKESLMISLFMTPFLFVGVYAGTWLHRLVDQGSFVKIVYGFLAITAGKLLIDSVPRLFF